MFHIVKLNFIREYNAKVFIASSSLSVQRRNGFLSERTDKSSSIVCFSFMPGLLYLVFDLLEQRRPGIASSHAKVNDKRNEAPVNNLL